MTLTFAATPARSRTLPRASRAPHSKVLLNSRFSEKIQITFGTRLINRDVPQEVVRRILDHDSPQMTSHYARLHDDTVRRHWEAARKVDITGRAVTFDPNGPLADAAWAKQRLARATQALPNGFCGLPVQKTCPHANALLTELTGPTAWRDEV